ncbi:MAG: hypothetical protein KJ808_02295 [Acidobacteria bacterium]|nr:hypothetical protein [Acidobacteriota bacterium]MBU4306303.1 hypothetical protein [Acidobacteriota bacterium]MBU4404584.1 hypothetical protein [Acidobacteriota bacterium]MCG2812369.1 hypothetical protein [Candidatus Aminicenantes bacterium]
MVGIAALSILTAIIMTGCRGHESAPIDNTSGAKRTFIMIHLEAGYRSCKENNLPPGLSIPDDFRLKDLGWQEYFWPTVIELVQKADEFGFKLTLALNPQWAEYILEDNAKVNLVKTWQENGHEMAFHHHGFDHPDWNGYSNRPEAENDGLYLGIVNDGYMFVENLASPYRVSSGTHSDLPLDFPSQMDIPNADIIFAEGNALDSYPQLGTVKSLKPYREPKPNGGFRVHLTIREYSTVMQISLDEATPILKEQYKNMSGDEVFGIVWHEFDYYRSKDKYIEWFKFIQEQGDKVQTMENINASYFYP